VDSADVVDEFDRRLWMRDHGLVYVTLATMVANRLQGDPVWTLLVGPFSSGKSEMTGALELLPEYHQVSTFSEAGLISGASNGTPGLLMDIDDFGLMVFKDLTTILSKHTSDRDGVLGCLREVYDDSYSPRLGTGALTWEGKVGMVGLLVRENLHHQGEIRARRSAVVAEFLAGLDIPDPPPDATEDEWALLSTLAELGRCAAPRGSGTGSKGDHIQRVPGPEGLGRLLGQFGQLLVAMRVIGVPGEEAWSLLAQIALDGMHPLRRKVVDLAVATKGQMTTITSAARLDLPHTSIRRHLEGRHARGVLSRVAYTGPEAWTASAWTRARWAAIAGSV
jgi:hypothetical protein